VVDDVISAGTSVRESAGLIEAAGARMTAVAIALDRQERGQHDRSAVQEVQDHFGIPVISIVNLDALLTYLETCGQDDGKLTAVHAYRERYRAHD
jgi:orotate phosphoribosyltransferase